MTTSARARNMYRIFLVFAVVCLLLAGALFLQSRELTHQFQALVGQTRQVEQSALVIRKQMRRTRVLAWAAAGGTVLLVAAAVLAGRRRER